MLGEHTLNPGERTELKLIFDTNGNPGPFRKIATLTADVAGQEETEVVMTGTVKEAPAAKIMVNPRRVVLSADKFVSEKKQTFVIVNNGTLPLVIARIYSKDSDTVYFDGKKEGDIVIGPGSSRKVDIDLSRGKQTDSPGQEHIAIESNARNAPKTGYTIIVQYGGDSK